MKNYTRQALVRIATLAAMLACCAPALAGLFKIGASREKKVGAEAAAEIEASSGVIVLRGPAAELVNEVGQKLVQASEQKDFDFHFTLVDLQPKSEKEKMINAFALPGGYVYVFRDMQEIVQTEDELAGVLAHEIIHATEHHWAKQQSSSWDRELLLTLGLGLSGAGRGVSQSASIANFAMTKRFSRKYEQAADDNGLKLMAKSGFNPQGMVRMLEALAKVTKDAPTLMAWESDHPQLKLRVERAQRHAQELAGGVPAPASTAALDSNAQKSDQPPPKAVPPPQRRRSVDRTGNEKLSVISNQ